MPIDTNQHNPTKIIEGCQVIIEISTDKKNSCSQKCSYAMWLNWERESGIPSIVPPCGKGIYIRWQHLIFFYLCTWFSCIKRIGQSCICWAVAVPNTEQIVKRWPSVAYIFRSTTSLSDIFEVDFIVGSTVFRLSARYWGELRPDSNYRQYYPRVIL